jgi:hypothetical protein
VVRVRVKDKVVIKLVQRCCYCYVLGSQLGSGLGITVMAECFDL